MLVYLDSSALRVLIDGTVESAALRRYLGNGATVISCRIAEVELPGATSALAGVALREVESTLARAAAEITTPGLDVAGALHLAAAVELRRELDGFVTYDSRYAATARSLRLPVVSPS